MSQLQRIWPRVQRLLCLSNSLYLTYGRVHRNVVVVEKARIHIVIALSVAVKPVAKRHIDDMSAVPEYRLSSLITSN